MLFVADRCWDVGGLGTLVLGIWLALNLDEYDFFDGWILGAIVLWFVATGLGQMVQRGLATGRRARRPADERRRHAPLAAHAGGHRPAGPDGLEAGRMSVLGDSPAGRLEPPAVPAHRRRDAARRRARCWCCSRSPAADMQARLPRAPPRRAAGVGRSCAAGRSGSPRQEGYDDLGRRGPRAGSTSASSCPTRCCSFIIVATVCAGIAGEPAAARRRRCAARRSRSPGIMLAACVVAVWAMSTKPT